MNEKTHQLIRKEIEENGIEDFMIVILGMCSRMESVPKDIFERFTRFVREISVENQAVQPKYQCGNPLDLHNYCLYGELQGMKVVIDESTPSKREEFLYTWYTCSVCGEAQIFDECKFCPSCGAEIEWRLK